ncbi:unnamed protein product [Gadus morhua 'NCC']
MRAVGNKQEVDGRGWMTGRQSDRSAPTVTDVNCLFCVGLRGLNIPDIVATDLDPRHRDPRRAACTPRGFNRAGLELGAAGGWWPGGVQSYRNRRVLAVRSVASSGGARREVRGGRLEVRGGRLEVLAVRGGRLEVRGGRLEALAAGGGKAGSRAAQGRQNEGLRREVLEAEASLEAAVAWRSWRRPTWKGRHGGPGGGSSSRPGGGQPGRPGDGGGPGGGGQLESWSRWGLEAAAAALLEVDYLRSWRRIVETGLEVASNGGGRLEVVATWRSLEATAGLEVLEGAILESLEAPAAAILEAPAGLEAANLEGLEAVVRTNLEVPAVASTWRRRRPGGPGGGGVLEGPEAAASWRGPEAAASWRARRRRASWGARRRRRPGRPGGGVLEVPAAAAPHPVKLNSSPGHHKRGGMSGVQIERVHISEEMRRRCGGPGGWPGGGPGGDGPGGRRSEGGS